MSLYEETSELAPSTQESLFETAPACGVVMQELSPARDFPPQVENFEESEEEMEWEDAETDTSFIMWNNYPTQKWSNFPREFVDPLVHAFSSLHDQDYIEAPLDPRAFIDEVASRASDFYESTEQSDSESCCGVAYLEPPLTGRYDMPRSLRTAAETMPKSEEEPVRERRYPVEVRGGNFILPAEMFPQDARDPQDIRLPVNYEQYVRITSEYRGRSEFFDRWFNHQESLRSRTEFLQIFNELLDDVKYSVSAGGRMSFPELADAAYWSDLLFKYRKSRDQLKAHFENRTIKADMDVRTDDMAKEVNTTFLDQREEVSDTGFITTQVSTPANLMSMPENEYHVRTVMAKPILAESISWSTSQETGKVIFEETVPGAFIHGPHRNLMSTFNFARMVVELEVKINSNKFNKGIAVVCFVPLHFDDRTILHWLAPGNLVALPHGRIDASISNSVKLRIPFAHPRSYFNLAQQDPFEQLGRLVIAVFTKLGSTTGASTTVDISIWASFKDCELHQPSQAHEVLLPGRITADAGVEGLAKAAIPMLTDMYPGASAVAGSVLGASANCDKPTDPLDIMRWVPNTVSALNFGEGIDRTTRLSLKPGSATVHKSAVIQTTKDDMDLHLLKKIPSRVAIVTLKTTDGPGTILKIIPVYPSLCADKRENDQPDPPVDLFEVPVLAYISRPFKFWRGGIRYTLIAAANQVMSWRIQIAYLVGWFSGDFNTAKYYAVLYWDGQEKHEISFVVPYMSTRPYNRCDQLLSIQDFQTPRPQHTDGTLVLHVVNRLTVPDASPQTVDISVLVSGADDYEVSFISDLSLYQGSGDVVADAMIEVVTTREQEEDVKIGYGMGVLGEFNSTLSESFMNLKTACRRYHKVYENVVTVDENSILSFVNSPQLSSVNKRFNNGNGIQYRTLTAHFGECFALSSGSLRYIFVIHEWNTQNNATVEIFHVPGVYENNFTPRPFSDPVASVLGACEATGAMVGTTKIQNSWQFEIPMYTPFLQLKHGIEQTGGKSEYTALNATGTVFIRVNAEKQTKMRFSLYQAVGDDFSFNYFKGVPLVQFEKLAEGARQLEDDAKWLYSSSFMPFPNVPSSTESEDVAHLRCGLARLKPPSPGRYDVQGSLRRAAETMPKSKSVSEDKVMADGLIDYLPRNPYTVVMNTVEQYGAVAKKANELISDVHERITPTQTQTQTQTLGFLDNILGNLPSLVGASTKIFGNIAALVSGFQAYLTGESIFVKACAIVTILREIFGDLLAWATESLTQLAMSIISAIGAQKGNQASTVQAEADIIEFIPVIIGVATSALVIFGFKNIPDDAETVKQCNNISNKLRLFNFGSTAISNIKALYKEMTEFTQWIIEEIMTYAAPQYLAQLKLQQGFGEIEDWAAFIELHESTDYVARCNYDRDFRNELLRCGDQATAYNNLLLTGKMKREANVVRGYVQRALKMCDAAKTAHRALPVRVDPLCVCMYGTTAMGKSAIMTKLGNQIMDRLGYPRMNRWVAHNATEKFFTANYRGQEAVYIDDISLFKDKEQYQNFANLKANTALPLNMAFDKGQMFTSDFIFCTTNVRYPELNECNENVALQRRRNILIEGRWRTPQIMTAVMRDRREDLRRGFAHLQFRVIPSICPQLARQLGIQQEPPTVWMEYEELLDFIVRRGFTYFRGQDELMNENLQTMGIEIPEEFVQKIIRREDHEQAEDAYHDAMEQLEQELLVDQGHAIDEEMVGPEENPMPDNPQEVPDVYNAVRPNPEADAGELDMEKVFSTRYLSTFSEEFIETLHYDGAEDMVKSSVVPDNVNFEITELQMELQGFRAMVEAQRLEIVTEHERANERRKNQNYPEVELKEKKSYVEIEYMMCVKKSKIRQLMSAISKKFKGVRDYISDLWEKAKEEYPLLKVFETFPAKIVAVAVAIFGLSGLAMKIAHKCYCHSVRNFGYRCRICGRWPVLDHCLNQPWILQEWQRIYGSEPYEPGRVTTKEEEARFVEIEDDVKLEKIWIGTKESCVAQVGPYSTNVTCGSALRRVVPNGGPYSVDTQGAALHKVVANGNVTEIIENRLYTAIHRVRCTVGLSKLSMNAVAIGGKQFFILKHFMDLVARVGSFEILHSGQWMPVIYEPERTRPFPDKDLMVVEIPSIQNIKSLVNHFIEESALKKIKKSKAVVVKVNINGIPVVMETEAEAIDHQRYSLDFAGKCESYVTRGVWKYHAPMGPGTCGSVLMTTENKANGHILGLHIASSMRGDSYAVLITREMVESAVVKGKLGTPLPKADFLVSPLIPEGHFGHIGKVERETQF